MTRRIGQLGLALLLGSGLLVTAYLLINTTFMFYDDEGYLLLTYRNFLAGARLYDDVFSQYGPWPYVYHQLVTTLLHEPLTHMLGRNLTALHWVLCALLCGALAARATGRTVAGVSTTLITFGLLWQMNAEPSHPGSLISAMLVTAAIAAAVSHDQARWTWLGVALGTATALLVLTKINVGLLFAAGAGAAALRLTAWPARWTRPAGCLAAAGLLAVPWGLMAKKLADPWALVFAVQFTAAAAGLCWVTPVSAARRVVPPRTWAVALTAFGLTVAAVCATVWLQGTSPRALLEAVLISPLRQPASFMVGFSWVPATWPVTLACWTLTAWTGWELRRRGEVSPAGRLAVIAARTAAAGVLLWHITTWLTIYGVGRFIVVCLPLLPVFLVPLRRPDAAPAAGAGISPWLPYLALPQVLHAFPVAGSQMGWGTFLFVPVFAAGLHEAWAAMPAAAARWAPRLGWSLLLVAGGWQWHLLAGNGYERYRTSKPLDLPGAEDIRLDGPARMTLRVLALNATVHADVLFSRPGMFSYNQWSGVPTPTLQNATHWFWLLGEPAQRAIISRLQQTPRSAIITNQGLDDFLETIKVPTRSPLQDYIREHYRPLFDPAGVPLKDFHFLVPRGSRAVPFGRLDILGRDDAATGGPVLIRTNIALDGRPAAVRLEHTYAPWKVLADYTAAGARVYLEPITSQGDTAGPPIQLPTRTPLRGLFRLSVFAAEMPKSSLPQSLVLTVIGAEGGVLSESIL
ncbi:MAG: hypothetical protein JNG83_04275 [Opitutaceae bacterium]|nr:hypothetical protein [Opitutaceae bacterium]